MKVTFNGGLISLTAENKDENQKLFDLANESNFTPTGQTKRTYTKRVTATKTHNRKERVAKMCPVIGCDKEAKSLALHMLMAHGIHKDGHISETVEFSKGEAPVPNLAVKLPNGEYRLVKSGGLLG